MVRLVWRCFLGLLGLPVIYVLASIFGALIPGPTTEPSVASEETVVIYLIGGPIHYDILLPTSIEARAVFAFAEEGGVPVQDSAYILAGWGSRAFYTSTGRYRDVRIRTVWQAATGDEAVLRVDAVGPVNGDLSGHRLELDRARYNRLLIEIAANVSGAPIEGAGFTETDAFFPATGRFSLFNTCNVWVARTLRAAGVPFGLWTPDPYSVRLAYAWHHQRNSNAAETSSR